MLLRLQESCDCKSWKIFEMMLMRMQGFTKKRPRVSMTKLLQEKSLMLETKSFFIIRVETFLLD